MLTGAIQRSEPREDGAESRVVLDGRQVRL